MRVLLDDQLAVHASLVAESWRRADTPEAASTSTTISRLRRQADDLERYYGAPAKEDDRREP